MNVLQKLEPNPKYAHLATPPKEWFYDVPDWYENDGIPKLRIDEQGRIAGLVANWDQCIIDGSEECWTAPRLPDNYDYAYQTRIVYENGEEDYIALLAATDGHAPPMKPEYSLEFNQGKRNREGKLYNDMAGFANRIAAVRFVNHKDGLMVLGALYPHVQDHIVRLADGSAISGHWQHVNGSGEHESFLGAVFVNTPGLPLTKIANASGYDIRIDPREDLIMSDVEKTCSCKENDMKQAAADTAPIDTPKDYYTIEEIDMRFEELQAQIDALSAAVVPLVEKDVFGG